MLSNLPNKNSNQDPSLPQNDITIEKKKRKLNPSSYVNDATLKTKEDPIIVIVTGGTSGIGLELVKQYAQQNNVLVYTFSSTQKKVDAAKEIFGNSTNISVCRFDIQDHLKLLTYVRKIIRHHGKIDILINNAAVPGEFEPFGSTSLSHTLKTIDINLYSPILLTYWIIKEMLDHGNNGGTIINISSVAIQGMKGGAAYSMAKSGLHTLTHSIAQDHPNLNVYSFDTGPVQTPMLDELMHADPNKCPTAAKILQLKDEKQIRMPKEIAEGIVYVTKHPDVFKDQFKNHFLTYNDVMTVMNNNKAHELSEAPQARISAISPGFTSHSMTPTSMEGTTIAFASQPSSHPVSNSTSFSPVSLFPSVSSFDYHKSIPITIPIHGLPPADFLPQMNAIKQAEKVFKPQRIIKTRSLDSMPGTPLLENKQPIVLNHEDDIDFPLLKLNQKRYD